MSAGVAIIIIFLVSIFIWVKVLNKRSHISEGEKKVLKDILIKTAREGKLSVMGSHNSAPLVVLHKPPLAEPAQIIWLSVGSKAWLSIRPP